MPDVTLQSFMDTFLTAADAAAARTALGVNFASPGPIGGTTPDTGAFTTLTLSSDLILSRAAAATLQLGANSASVSTRQTIKGHNVTTGNGGELVLRAGTGTGGAVGTQGVWLGVTSANALKQYDFNGAILGGFFNEGLRGYLRFCGGSGGDVTLASNASNGNVEFVPNGTGKVKFGAYTTSASHTAAGYIEILDSGGNTRKLAVVA